MNELNKAIKRLNLERYDEMLIRDEYSISFNEWIYLLRMNDKTYVGNLQVPKLDEHKDTRVHDKYKYWFSGTSSQFNILYVYDNVHNHNLCNQKIFNVVKKCVVDGLYNNFNVQQLPDDYDIKDMFGKHISNWRRNISQSLKNYNINDCRNDLCDILDDIISNINRWANLLVMFNRFTYISLEEEDIKTRDLIGFNDWPLQKQCLFIHMKDWLTKITINTLNHKNSDDLYFYKMKLKHSKFYNENLFNSIKSNFFKHSNVVRIILSMMYMSSTEKQVTNTYKKYICWLEYTYIPYFNKYINNKIYERIDN